MESTYLPEAATAEEPETVEAPPALIFLATPGDDAEACEIDGTCL